MDNPMDENPQAKQVEMKERIQAWLLKFPVPIRIPVALAIMFVGAVAFVAILPFAFLYATYNWCRLQIVIRLPIKYQRRAYQQYKKYLTNKVIPKLGAMMAYPFSIFVELELDKVFEEGGMPKVLEAIQAWPDRFMKRWENIEEVMKSGGKPNADMMGMGLLFDTELRKPGEFRPGDTQTVGVPTKFGDETVNLMSTVSPVYTEVSMTEKKDELAAAVEALKLGQKPPEDGDSELELED